LLENGSDSETSTRESSTDVDVNDVGILRGGKETHCVLGERGASYRKGKSTGILRDKIYSVSHIYTFRPPP